MEGRGALPAVSEVNQIEAINLRLTLQMCDPARSPKFLHCLLFGAVINSNGSLFGAVSALKDILIRVVQRASGRGRKMSLPSLCQCSCQSLWKIQDARVRAGRKSMNEEAEGKNGGTTLSRKPLAYQANMATRREEESQPSFRIPFRRGILFTLAPHQALSGHFPEPGPSVLIIVHVGGSSNIYFRGEPRACKRERC
jgi:hypothetical protein